MTDSLTVPDNLTFEQAIALTHTLMKQMQHQQIGEADLEKTLTALVASENGARGFFVTYLTDDRPLADAPSAAVVQALQSSPEIVAELLVKNLAMSSAMAIAHRRNQNEAMAEGSDRVQTRTTQLIQKCSSPKWLLKQPSSATVRLTGVAHISPFWSAGAMMPSNGKPSSSKWIKS